MVTGTVPIETDDGVAEGTNESLGDVLVEEVNEVEFKDESASGPPVLVTTGAVPTEIVTIEMVEAVPVEAVPMIEPLGVGTSGPADELLTTGGGGP